uniref:Putative secreted protein n=1 Tax=Ixodes ricinus TaxID=34613 RepID=A0A6B0UBR7_IXORI
MQPICYFIMSVLYLILLSSDWVFRAALLLIIQIPRKQARSCRCPNKRCWDYDRFRQTSQCPSHRRRKCSLRNLAVSWILPPTNFNFSHP